MKKFIAILSFMTISSTVFAGENLNCSVSTKTAMGLGGNFDKQLFQGLVERGDLLFVKDGKAVKIKSAAMTAEIWKANENAIMTAASIQDNDIVLSISTVVLDSNSQKTDAVIANKLSRATFMSDTKNLAISCVVQ